MSKAEVKAAIQACKLFVDDYEITEKNNKNKCKKFFEIIRHIRLSLQITTELLKRIEALEEQINNLNINQK